MARARKTQDIPPLKGFSSLLEESEWWDQLSIEEIIAMSEPDAEDIRFVDARPKKAVSLRLTESLIDKGKEAAAELGMGYQTLFRMWIMDGLRRHLLRKLAESRPREERRQRPARQQQRAATRR
jgi:predicted DNA binding CopG/RHH family protein